MVVPLFVGRQKSIKALEEAMNKREEILLAAQKRPRPTTRRPEDIYRVGTLGSVVQLLRLPDGTVKVLVEGKKRARVRELPRRTSSSWSRPRRSRSRLARRRPRSRRSRAAMNSTFEHYVKLNKKIPPR